MGIIDSLFNFASKKDKKSRPSYEQHFSMFEGLSDEQKIAIYTMLASLAAAPTDSESKAMVQKMLFQSASMMGLSEQKWSSYTQTQTKLDQDKMLRTIDTIKDEGVIQWLIYSAYGIVATNHNSQAEDFFLTWFNRIGYSDEYIKETIEKVEALGRAFRRSI